MKSLTPIPIMSQKITVVESSGLSSAQAQSFTTEGAALAYVITRVRALVATHLAARFEHAVLEKIVSEDGVKATSEVVAGTLAFARALTKAYAPQIAIVVAAPQKDDADN